MIDLSKIKVQGTGYYISGVKLEVDDAFLKLYDEYKFWSKVDKKGYDDCWEWKGGKNKGGYGQLLKRRDTDGKPTSEKAHRKSYMIHKGSIPDGFLVCHSCDNPSCVNPHHLFLGSNSDNMKDMYKKGRGNDLSGENNHLSKIKKTDLSVIIELNKSGVGFTEIGRKYGVSYVSIRNIVKGRTWGRVTNIKRV